MLMRYIWALLCLFLAAPTQAWFPHGAASPSISGSPSATTIYASSAASVTAMGCDTTPGSYAKTAVDLYPNSGMVAGLLPSTLYYCKLTSGGVDQLFQTTTLAAQVTTALTGATFSAGAVAVNNQNSGDTYYNTTCDDGVTYVVTDDTYNSWGTAAYSPMMIGKFISTSPFTGASVNVFSSFNSLGPGPKLFGLKCFNKVIYAIYSSICSSGCGGVPSNVFTQQYPSILISRDHGATWCNDQTPNGTCLVGGTYPVPLTYSFFDAASGCAQSSFVSYGADNGTVLPTHRKDNADAFAYFLCTSPVAGQTATGYQFNGDKYFLARMPLADLTSADNSRVKFFIGGPAGNGIDGSLDGAWQSGFSGAVAILTNAGKLSNAIMQYMPATGRYITFDWYWPSPGTWSNSTRITYEGAHPWDITPTPIEGPTSITPAGFYNAVPYNPSALTATLNGNPMTLLVAGDFSAGGAGPYYQLYTMTVVFH